MKGSSSRMKNKMGAQMGAFIKMKQEKVYVYQLFYVVCYVPIIAPSNKFNELAQKSNRLYLQLSSLITLAKRICVV